MESNLYTGSSFIAAYVSIEFGVTYSKSGIKRLLHERVKWILGMKEVRAFWRTIA